MLEGRNGASITGYLLQTEILGPGYNIMIPVATMPICNSRMDENSSVTVLVL